jgi:hypothetical protein
MSKNYYPITNPHNITFNSIFHNNKNDYKKYIKMTYQNTVQKVYCQKMN